MFQSINSQLEFQQAIEQNEAVIFYFSQESCNVCKVLKPKIIELVENDFTAINLYYIDTITTPEIAAQNHIFNVPTLLVFFAGKEYIRKSRNFGIDQLGEEIRRPYDMIFNHKKNL